MDDIAFRVDQLTLQLEDSKKKRAEVVAAAEKQMAALRERLQAALDLSAEKGPSVLAAQVDAVNRDDTFIRTFEWRLDDEAVAKAEQLPKGEALWSPEFSIMGVEGMRLEFFPNGREGTWMPGFCALFLWCPAGTRIRYQLRVGSHMASPDEDFYSAKMGQGHSNLCFLAAQIDQTDSSLTLGVDILSIERHEAFPEGLVLKTIAGDGSVLPRAAEVLQNRHMNAVEWRIKDIARRVRETPRGFALFSPTFSIAGVRGMIMEFYPNGVQGDPTSGKEGHCGFYLRCPEGTKLEITLFVGQLRKGPIKTVFGRDAAKGLPEFTRLKDQMPAGVRDLVVGASVSNSLLDEAERQVLLEI